MIICYRYGFVFVKTRKTAGSSLEIALSCLCEPGDVVTGLTAEEECIRSQEGGYGPAGHFKAFYQYSPLDLSKLVRHGRRATRFRGHAGLDTARQVVGAAWWPRLLRITSERNPWDKAVSRYYWQKRRWEKRPRRAPFPPFGDYLEYLEEERPELLSSWDLYTLDGRVEVDLFIFFEDLSAGLSRLSGQLGLYDPIVLPRYRAKARGGARRDYRSEYDSRSADIIGHACKREIEYFGYKFDAPGNLPSIASTDLSGRRRGTYRPI